MKKGITLMLALAGLVLSATNMQAQINTPAASPMAKVSQTVGLTDIGLEYSRPSMKGRTIFATDGLVPFGKMWRTGANLTTKISFSDDVKVAGIEVAAGQYAIFTIPDASEWEVILYTDVSGGGLPREWDETLEAARFTVASMALPYAIESFTIGISDLSNAGATIRIMWEKTGIAIPVEVEVESKVMADIEKAMAGTTAREYYVAASYFHDNKKDMNQALAWVKKANEMDPKFWQLRREALILAELNRYPEAIAAAQKSKTMATEAGNEDYVRMNEKSIEEWSSMKETPEGKKMRKESKS